MAEAEAEGLPASLTDAYYASLQSPCPGADISAYAAPNGSVDQAVLGFQGIFVTALVTWGIALILILPLERTVWRCRGRNWCCYKTAVSMGWHLDDDSSDDGDEAGHSDAAARAKANAKPAAAVPATPNAPAVAAPAVAVAAASAAASAQPVLAADVNPTLISAVAVVDPAHTNLAVRPPAVASLPPGVPAGHVVATDGSWSAANPMARGRTVSPI